MIGFVGLSHLGIVYGAATAAKGFDVLGFDPDAQLCEALAAGRLPVAEPGLGELSTTHRARLRFTTDPARLTACKVVFYSRDVSTDSENRSDLGPLRDLIRFTVPHLAPEAIVVVVCQVPPGFTRSLLHEYSVLAGRLFYQVETLIFGAAVERAMKPERYMIGCAEPGSALPQAYGQWLDAFGCPLLPMRYESAELAKIAINCYLVSTVSTTNTLAEICENAGADWSEIAPALRLDRRIGPHAYLTPGLGIAGGNLERDLVTVQSLAARHGTEAGIVAAWQRNSQYRRDWALRRVHEAVLAKSGSPRLAWWGLAYKQDTHSTKNSPSLELAGALGDFTKIAYDPLVRLASNAVRNLEQVARPLDACVAADALVVMTPWKEFSGVAPADIKAALRGNIVIDPFRMLDAAACRTVGLVVHQLGAATL